MDNKINITSSMNNLLSRFTRRFKDGSIGTKLSHFIFGAGNIYHKQYIKGLLYDTFFTKLNDVDNNKTYCDKLGVFDQARDKTEKNLFKNSIYLTNSWVGKRFSKKEGKNEISN